MIKIPSDGTDDIEPAAPSIVDQVDAFFGADTPLRMSAEVGGRPYEERPQQRAMALEIAGCVEAGEHLCIEAPTGIGKSFAYLIPAVYLAKATGKSVVITTHTIALQEQLLERDIPVLQNLLDVPFSAALAKGRENYICGHRLRKATERHQEYLPSPDLIPEVEQIRQWYQQTKDGSRSDLDFNPGRQTWSAVCSEPGVCPIESDGDTKTCHFLRARRRLFGADIVVTNHALFSIDLAMREETDGEQSILPNYVAAIIDEAHTYRDVASSHLGIHVSTYNVTALFNRLYNPHSKRGLLSGKQANDAQAAAFDARGTAERFFTLIVDWVQQHDDHPVTYTTPGQIPNQLRQSWNYMFECIRDLLEEEGVDPDLVLELRALSLRLKDVYDRINAFLNMEQEQCVYWLELLGHQKRHISFNCVPIDISGTLREVLFNRECSVIMTSATLAVRNSLDYFLAHVGGETARCQILDSPFDFKEQVDLHVPYTCMPDPKDIQNYIPAATEQIQKFIMQTEGKAFVLFTSYAMMNTIADNLEGFFATNRIQLLVQGRELQRGRMLEIFREDVNSVIFGTDSFWMGVDVPGEALSNVIIVKLPFQVPTHPLIAARKCHIESNGGNAFRDYFLPEAVLKFRQGIGRLIRSRNDHGIIVVLDSRIVRTNYGSVFLESIPDCRRHIF